MYPSGLFNNNYSKYNSTYNEYYHDGVDFPATRATPIHSFIFGEIKDCYTSGNGKDGKNGGTGYGNMLFIENFQKNKVYVLCHIPKTDL